MKSRVWLVVDVLFVIAGLAGAVVCWNAGVRTSAFAATTDGSPAYSATHYSGSWIGFAVAALLIGVLAAIDGGTRLIRR